MRIIVDTKKSPWAILQGFDGEASLKSVPHQLEVHLDAESNVSGILGDILAVMETSTPKNSSIAGEEAIDIRAGGRLYSSQGAIPLSTKDLDRSEKIQSTNRKMFDRIAQSLHDKKPISLDFDGKTLVEAGITHT